MKKHARLSAVAALIVSTALVASPAYAQGKGNGGGKGKNPPSTSAEPCHTNTEGELVCPYADDEPGEYTENFYSGDWGSAGGGGIIIGDTATDFWDAHIVYKLDQEEADEGVHDIVVQDSRVRDKNAFSLNLNKWVRAVNANTDLNVTIGSCDTFPEANCISVIDFTHYDLNSNVAGYMQPRGLHDRAMAFNPRHMKDKKAAEYTIWHEGGHALGLSHKHSPDGVMSYHRRDNTYSDDEIAALQLAYGGGTTAAKSTGNMKKSTSTDFRPVQ